jgi:hypothetical protein
MWVKVKQRLEKLLTERLNVAEQKMWSYAGFYEHGNQIVVFITIYYILEGSVP